jgi:hypothetical protein
MLSGISGLLRHGRHSFHWKFRKIFNNIPYDSFALYVWCMDLKSWPQPIDGWPEKIWSIPYSPLASPSETGAVSWFDGSNCQRFAYEILKLFGLNCPPLRSSNLWREEGATAIVVRPEPLDLVFFGAGSNPYGAHIGVWMASDEVLHLCKEIGIPSVWPMAEFAKRPRYKTVIGFKRITHVD